MSTAHPESGGPGTAPHPSWVRRGRRNALIVAMACMAGIFLVSFGIRLIGQGPETLIDLLHSREKLTSLRAVLGDPDFRAAIEERLSRSALWHIGTIEDEAGFEHTFYFAGRARATTRLHGLAVRTAPDGDTYRATGVSEKFSFLHLGGKPSVTEAGGLDIIHAALGDPSVIEELLGALAGDVVEIGSVRVEAIDGSRSDISFTAWTADGTTPILRSWIAERNDQEGYTFSKE
jgi:hypothetical protein